AGEGIPRDSQLFGVEVIRQIGLEASFRLRCVPRRLAHVFTVDIQGQRHRGHDLTKQLLVPLVDVTGGHELQVPPIIGQADVLALADRLGQALVDMPAHPPDDDPLIAQDRAGSPGRRRRGLGSGTTRDCGHRVAPLLNASRLPQPPFQEWDPPIPPFLSAHVPPCPSETLRQSGHSFGFHSIATDHVGLSQAMPLTAQATTEVSLPTPPPPSPPPPVIVESVHWETIKVKVGNGKKARTKSETALEIQFSGLVAGSGDLAAYQLSSVATKKVKKKAVTSFKPIRLTSAVPASSPMASSVLLLPATKPNLSQSDRIQIIAADLTDAHGRPIDGNDDGVPGGDYVATLSRSGVTFGAVPLALARTTGKPTAT